MFGLPQGFPQLFDAIVGLARWNFTPRFQGTNHPHLLGKFLQIGIEGQMFRRKFTVIAALGL